MAGSRGVLSPIALEKLQPFSDLALLVLGAPLCAQLRGTLEEAFDESDLPFRVDIAEAATLSPEFRARIEPQAVALN